MEASEFFIKAAIAMIPFFWMFYMFGKAVGRDEEKLKGRTVKIKEKNDGR